MNSPKLPNFNTVKRECPLYTLFNFYATKSIVVGAFIFVAVNRGFSYGKKNVQLTPPATTVAVVVFDIVVVDVLYC